MATIGFKLGSITRVKVDTNPQPSIIAASSSSLGLIDKPSHQIDPDNAHTEKGLCDDTVDRVSQTDGIHDPQYRIDGNTTDTDKHGARKQSKDDLCSRKIRPGKDIASDGTDPHPLSCLAAGEKRFFGIERNQPACISCTNRLISLLILFRSSESSLTVLLPPLRFPPILLLGLHCAASPPDHCPA